MHNRTYKYTTAMGVITGLHAISEFGDIRISLPTKYLGEGNDICAGVLDVLYVREIARVTDTESAYAEKVKDRPSVAATSHMMDITYRHPLPNVAFEDWQG